MLLRHVAAIPTAVSPLQSSELVVDWRRGHDLAFGDPRQGTSRTGPAFEGLAEVAVAPPLNFCVMDP